METEQAADLTGLVKEADLVKTISFPLHQAKGWMKFIGLLNIIYGVLSVISLWGILWCWLWFWMGALMYKAAGSIEKATFTGDPNDTVFALEKLRTLFTVQGVLALLGLILGAIAFFMMLGAGITLFDMYG